DGSLLAAGSGTDLFVHIWDVTTGKEQRALGKHRGGVTCVTFSPDGRLVAGSCLGNTAHIWELATGQERLTIKHGGNITGLAFSPDGRYLVTANNGRNFVSGPNGMLLDTGNEYKDKVHVWSLADGKEVHRFTGHHGAVEAVVFSSDGRQLASASSDTTTLL